MRRQRLIRRRPSRHSIRIPCQVVRERDFRLVADQIENLSTWGMLVSPADPVLTGEKVLVSFQIPGTKRWLDLSATIARVVHGRRPREMTRKLGLVFDDIRPYERFQLRKALASAPLAPPSARPGRRDQTRAMKALAKLVQASPFHHALGR